MGFITSKFALITIGAVVAVFAVAAGAFWYLVLRDDAPPEVNLADAVGSLSTPTSSPATSTSTASTDGDAIASGGVDGAWGVAADGETFAGYRVGEELANIGTATAVGRTAGVAASVEIADGVLETVEVEVDLTTLQSDNSLRDGQLRTQALETNTYPTATFVATGAFELPAQLESGEAVTLDLAGALTLHGVTRDVVVPLEVQLVDGYLVVVGSIDIVFADYEIDQPSGASVLSIEDHGVMELQIVLAQGGVSAS